MIENEKENESLNKMFQQTQLYGLYRGEIKDRVDPLKLGRCKILIYNVYAEDIPLDAIPWAWPKFAGAGHAKSGQFHVPPVGTTVYVQFEQGFADKPVWEGGWWGKPDDESECPDKCHDLEDNPDNHIIETPGGHYLEIDDRDGTQKIRLRTKSGHEIIMDETVEADEKENPDDIEYKQAGIHIHTKGGQEIHMIDEEDREGLHTGIEMRTTSGHFLRMKDSEDKEGAVKGIEMKDAKGNMIQMDNTTDIMTIYWQGDANTHITDNVTFKSKNLSFDIAEKFSMKSSQLEIKNSDTKASTSTWTWSGDVHTRNGKSNDVGGSSHS